ncbi:MAG: uL15 family ribosomal protein [Alphaproteobacteria bacterium]
MIKLLSLKKLILKKLMGIPNSTRKIKLLASGELKSLVSIEVDFASHKASEVIDSLGGKIILPS